MMKYSTIKEIYEIPAVIKRVIKQDRKKLNVIIKCIKSSKGVFFIGSGTAGYAGLEASYLFSRILKRHVNFIPASEFDSFISFIRPESLVIAISQSGETIDVLQAVKLAKKKGATVISLVNRSSSKSAKLSHYYLNINAGPEKSILATKTYIAQLCLVLILAFGFQGKLNTAQKELSGLSNKVKLLFKKSFVLKLKKLAKKLKGTEDILTIGQDLHYPTALESALKLKEGCYIHAEAIASGELRHGILAMLNKCIPCLIHFTGNGDKDLLNDVKGLKKSGGYLIGIGPKPYALLDLHIKVPKVKPVFTPIINIISVQLLVYYLSLEKGINPDKPRHLVKSVKKR